MAEAVEAKGGFRRKKKIFDLDFTGTPLDGLNVEARSAPIGLFMQIGQLADSFDNVEDADAAKILGVMTELVDTFAQVLIAWDLLDDNDEPVPANAQGLLSLEMDELMFVITAWQNAAAAVPAPLPQASTAGSPSLVGSMPMEPLSESQAS